MGSSVLQTMWDRAFWEGVWPYLGPWDSVRLRTASTHWNVPGMYGPHGELSFFFIKKETQCGPCSKCCGARPVGEKDFSLPGELARVALSCHTALDLLSQEMHEAWQLGCCYQEACCHGKRAFSHRGRAVIAKERDAVRE